MNLQDLEKIACDLRLEPDARFARLQATAQEARLRGHYTKAELLAICRWKSPRSSPLCALNLEAQVMRATRTAFAADSERERMEALLALRGVAVPSASALLAAADPTKFGVIDVRAWRLLHEAKVVARNRSGRGLSVNNWLQYLHTIRSIAKKVGTTPRLVELSLYRAHKSGTTSRTLYGSAPRSKEDRRCPEGGCR